MRDSNRHAFESMKQGVFRIVEKQAGPKAGPNVSLSQVTSRLIERWDEMSEEERLTVQVFIDWDVLVGDINAD